VCGRVPFPGASTSAALLEHLTAKVPDVRSLNTSAPRQLNELVQRLLRKDPVDRYQTAAAVVHDLDALAGLAAGQEDSNLVVGTRDQRRTLVEPAFVERTDEMRCLEQAIGLEHGRERVACCSAKENRAAERVDSCPRRLPCRRREAAWCSADSATNAWGTLRSPCSKESWTGSC
jgi:serine/threonine protein kinase